jgi:hypothetical protein
VDNNKAKNSVDIIKKVAVLSDNSGIPFSSTSILVGTLYGKYAHKESASSSTLQSLLTHDARFLIMIPACSSILHIHPIYASLYIRSKWVTVLIVIQPGKEK